MTFTVVYTTFAEYQLAEIWLRASNRDAVRQAADTLEKVLHRSPQQQGRAGQKPWRVLLIGCLKFTFEVIADDCKVVVLSVQQRH